MAAVYQTFVNQVVAIGGLVVGVYRASASSIELCTLGTEGAENWAADGSCVGNVDGAAGLRCAVGGKGADGYAVGLFKAVLYYGDGACAGAETVGCTA